MFGWGKKKEVEPDGYLGELSERQEKCFQEFKAWIHQQNWGDNPWFTDTHYLKFCRARKFELDKVQEMWTNYMTYRKENNIDTILSTYVFEKRPQVSEHYPNGYCGIDKMGRPIYIERNGMVNVNKVWEVIEEPELVMAFRSSYERLTRHIFMACSHLKKEQI